MLITEKCNTLKGFSDVPLENVIMSNVIIQPGEGADEKIVQLSMVNNISIDNIKIAGRQKAADGISSEKCTNVSVTAAS